MFNFLVVITATIAALHVACYGYYTLKQEKNRRGGIGTLIVAFLTLLAPILALWLRAALG